MALAAIVTVTVGPAVFFSGVAMRASTPVFDGLWRG
jgi:hypothetical protein